MNVWVVTALGKEEDKFGKILAVHVRCFGVYTTETEADQIAAKHQGVATPFVADDEALARLAYWENPGFVRV